MQEETVATGDMESAGDAPPALEGSVEGSYTARIAIQKEVRILAAQLLQLLDTATVTFALYTVYLLYIYNHAIC